MASTATPREVKGDWKYRGIDLRPNLYRVAVTVLTLALSANFLNIWTIHYRYPRGDDASGFIWINSIASLICVAVMLATAFWPRLIRWREEALILAVFVWMSSAFEYWTDPDLAGVVKVRQIMLYVSFAILAAGTFIAQQAERQDDDRPGSLII